MESTTGIAALLELFTTVSAWLWDEVGLFCQFVLDQPLLLLSLAIPFIGLIVNFFLRIFKTV